MTLKVNLLLCRLCYAYYDETAEARITRFSLYFSYLRIKFDDEIRRDSLRISSVISDLPASTVIVTSMLRCTYSHSLLLDRSVTCVRCPLHTDGKGANNIVWEANAILYSHIHIELKT